MKIGIAADHAGFELKEKLVSFLQSLSYDLKDFGPFEMNKHDDYPDFAIPLAEAVASQDVERGIAICGSGVGASIAANKVHGARAALINDHFSAHQGVEDDDMNIICIGARTTGEMAAQDFIQTFLSAKFTNEERHIRRLNKVKALEK